VVTGQELASANGSLKADPIFSWYFDPEWLDWTSGLYELRQNFIKKGSGQVTVPWVLPVDINDIRLQGSYTDAHGKKTTIDRELLTEWVLYDFSVGH
jgi:hypothetical protein